MMPISGKPEIGGGQRGACGHPSRRPLRRLLRMRWEFDCDPRKLKNSQALARGRAELLRTRMPAWLIAGLQNRDDAGRGENVRDAVRARDSLDVSVLAPAQQVRAAN